MPGPSNTTLLRNLSLEAEALSCIVSNSQFPVILRLIAARRRVTAVDFRPLLVDAMLTTHKAGFRILFNSNGEDATDLIVRYQSEDRENLLPPRLRFSLAHEIAHTLFYDLSEDTPEVSKKLRSGGKLTALENLEKNCNKLAAALLLPRTMLETAFRQIRKITPEALIAFSREAGVSLDVLIRRLADVNSPLVNRYFRGCIIFVRFEHSEPVISAVAKPQHLNIARDLLLMRTGERWQLSNSEGEVINPALLPAKSNGTFVVETQCAKTFEKYEILTHEVAGSNSKLVVIQAEEMTGI